MNRIIAEFSVELHTESDRPARDIAKEFARWMERELAGIDSSTDCELHSVGVVRAGVQGEVED